MPQPGWQELFEQYGAQESNPDAPVKEPVAPVYRETYRNRERRRLAMRVHPVHALELHADPEARCGNCRFRVLSDIPTARMEDHWKCEHMRAHWTAGRGTDALPNWPGCALWERKVDDGDSDR